VPAMGVLMERLAISALFLCYNDNDDLPVVWRKFSCPQGNSRRGALIGDGADGCSVYARCDSARSSVTREKDMMDDISTMDVLYSRHTLLMSRKAEEVVAGDLDVHMHARMPCAWRVTGYVRRERLP
jgi:hypothetical protein